MELESIFGLMEGAIMDTGKMAKCREKEFTSGPMERNTMEITKKIKSMGMVLMNGHQGKNMKVNGI
jgi:hypothetical protein